jgi:hypothetical protein
MKKGEANFSKQECGGQKKRKDSQDPSLRRLLLTTIRTVAPEQLQSEYIDSRLPKFKLLPHPPSQQHHTPAQTHEKPPLSSVWFLFTNMNVQGNK